MEHMTPKRLKVMLAAYESTTPTINGLTWSESPSGEFPQGVTTFGVCMVPLLYDGPTWWHVATDEIAAELPHDPRDIKSIHNEIRRVLTVLLPHLSVDEVSRLREAGWLQPND